MPFVLTLATPLPAFSAFLRDSFGIDDNDVSVQDAARAAKTAAWSSYCEAWGVPASELTTLHSLLMKVRKPVTPAAPSEKERTPLSPDSQARLDDSLKMQNGMPDMTNPKLGARIGYGGAERLSTTPFDLSQLKAPPAQLNPAQTKRVLAKEAKQKEMKAVQQLKDRTIHVVKPPAGWELSPSAKLAAANWAGIEKLLGTTRKTDATESFIEFTLTEDMMRRLKEEHSFDLVEERKRSGRGNVRTAARLASRAASPALRVRAEPT